MQDKNEYYAQALARMIRVNTVSSREQTDISCYYALQDVMRELFPHVFATCEVENFKGNLLMRWKGSGDSLPVLFMNHQDVVAPGKGWIHDPFAGEISEGRLWGRGTLDDKGGLFGMLQAAEELMAEGFVPSHDIYFESSRTEETTGKGANYISGLLKKRGIRFSMVLDEGGEIMEEPIKGAHGRFAMIGVGEKANVELKFVAKSNGGHASTPGKNTSLVRLGRFMAYVEKHDPFTVEMPEAIGEMLKQLSKGMDAPLANVCAKADTFAPVLGKVIPKVSPVAGAMFKTTLAFTQAGGSTAVNVLPSEAYVVGNMRCAHHEDNRKSIRKISRIAKKFDIETEIMDAGFMSPLTDHKGDAFGRVEKALASVYPDVIPTPYIMTGASDSRFFGRVSDGCIRFQPFIIDEQQLDSIHGAEENISIECLANGVEFYKYLMAH